MEFPIPVPSAVAHDGSQASADTPLRAISVAPLHLSPQTWWTVSYAALITTILMLVIYLENSAAYSGIFWGKMKAWTVLSAMHSHCPISLKVSSWLIRSQTTLHQRSWCLSSRVCTNTTHQRHTCHMCTTNSSPVFPAKTLIYYAQQSVAPTPTHKGLWILLRITRGVTVCWIRTELKIAVPMLHMVLSKQIKLVITSGEIWVSQFFNLPPMG